MRQVTQHIEKSIQHHSRKRVVRWFNQHYYNKFYQMFFPSYLFSILLCRKKFISNPFGKKQFYCLQKKVRNWEDIASSRLRRKRGNSQAEEKSNQQWQFSDGYTFVFLCILSKSSQPQKVSVFQDFLYTKYTLLTKRRFGFINIP